MVYRERAPAAGLAGLVKAYWTLEATGDADRWIEHRAMPDGCVEIIRRVAGRSCWRSEQPEAFAVGIADRPADFAVSGDARFAAVRLWPWAWSALTDLPLAQMWDDWIPGTDPALRPLCEALPDFDAAEAMLAFRLSGYSELKRIGEAVLASTTVAEMRSRCGMDARTLQRWFARNVGMAPSRYLRLLRFQKAFEDIPDEPSLAMHAAAHGFADQAHMAREFRSLGGISAREARRRATGPFLR